MPLLLILLACGGPAAEAPATPERPSTAAPDPRVAPAWVPLADRALPDGVRPRAIAAICEQVSCGGRFASVKLFRAEDRSIGRLYWLSDPQACSHGPAVYFTPDGVQEKVIPNRPMRPEEVDALHEPWREGLTEAEEIDDPCPR